MSSQPEVFADNDFCFACGTKNPLGLQLQFYARDGMLCSRIVPKRHWQGFSGVVHGGIQATILDDLMSNHLFRLEHAWATTGELTVRYRRPVPVDQLLIASSRIETHKGRIWEMAAQINLADDEDGAPLTVAHGRFIEVPLH